MAAAPTAGAAVKKAPKQLPAPNSDFYQLVDVLTPDERAIVKKVRAYMENKVQPIITNARVMMWPASAGMAGIRAAFQIRPATSPMPCQTPQIMKVQLAPCQSPPSAIVTIRLI